MIGRAQELAAVRHRLTTDARLLTVVGPPGVGKTRLAVAVATDLADQLAHGAWLVDLAPLREPSTVLAAVAQVLRLAGPDEPSELESLQRHLRSRELLLVLDNFEQVLAAAPQVAELISTCLGLRVLVTSREPLRLRWEHVFPLAPLGLPDLRQPLPLEALAQVPAVALFLERARAIRPDFALTPDGAAPLAELCVGLDGLPLALELAAARIGLLSPTVMLARLASRLPLPRRNVQDAPIRHQTLRDALSWSYDLLDDDEQALLRRLGTFVGGFTLEAVDAVGSYEIRAASDPDVPSKLTTRNSQLDLVASLVDKSLLRRDDGPDGEPRFTMLETIREYALGRLEANGELDEARRRHATYFLELAERAEPELAGPDQTVWFERLELEAENLSAALRWAGERDDPELELRLAGALGRFCWMRGHLREGRHWLDRALRRGHGSPGARAKALVARGVLAFGQGDLEQAAESLEAGLAIFRALPDEPQIVRALSYLGMTRLSQGHLHQARACLMEGLALGRAHEDGWGVALALRTLASVARSEGDFRQAEVLLGESLDLYRASGDALSTSITLMALAEAAAGAGRQERALPLLAESLTLAQTLAGNRRVGIRAAEVVVDVAASEGDPLRVTRLLAAADALRHAITVPRITPDPAWHADAIAALKGRLDGEAFAEAWAEGSALGPDQIVEEALLAIASVPPPTPRSGQGGPAEEGKHPPSAAPIDHARGPLSEREQQVLRLVAAGRSNKEIGQALVITVHTAKAHVASILKKLGAETRAQAVALAAQRDLLTGE